jgi:hypothetical protein
MVTERPFARPQCGPFGRERMTEVREKIKAMKIESANGVTEPQHARSRVDARFTIRVGDRTVASENVLAAR